MLQPRSAAAAAAAAAAVAAAAAAAAVAAVAAVVVVFAAAVDLQLLLMMKAPAPMGHHPTLDPTVRYQVALSLGRALCLSAMCYQMSIAADYVLLSECAETK